jgi:glycine oxidase
MTRALVIGAGPVGLCAALALKTAGLAVTVLEDGRRGAGWASGGMLGAVHEGLVGAAHPAFTAMGFQSRAMWATLARDVDVALAADTLHLATDAEEATAWAEIARRAEALGFPMREVAVPAGVRAIAVWTGGGDLTLDPRAALRALRAACARAGVTFLPGVAAAIGPGRATLTSGEVVAADILVLATGHGGAGLSRAAPELAAIAPVKGHLIRLPPSKALAPGRTLRAGALYLIARADGLVVGATSEPGRDDADKVEAGEVARLLSRAVDRVPALAGVSPIESWAGVRPATPDARPLLGESAIPGVLIAAGAHRNGWLLAPVMGAVVARLAQGENPGFGWLEAMSPGRFPNARGPL